MRVWRPFLKSFSTSLSMISLHLLFNKWLFLIKFSHSERFREIRCTKPCFFFTTSLKPLNLPRGSGLLWDELCFILREERWKRDSLTISLRILSFFSVTWDPKISFSRSLYWYFYWHYLQVMINFTQRRLIPKCELVFSLLDMTWGWSHSVEREGCWDYKLERDVRYPLIGLIFFVGKGFRTTGFCWSWTGFNALWGEGELLVML